MSQAIVLTDGAKFKCAHMAAPLGIQEGITISLTAQKITVDNTKPILNGAVISGFTTEKGCSFQVAGVPTPCVAFQLATVAATGSLSENDQKVYIDPDKNAIALALSTGNAQPGLTIIETQTKLKA